MKVAYLTTCDIRAPLTWPKNLWGLYGAAHFLARALEEESIALQYLGPLQEERSWSGERKKKFYNVLGKQYWGYAETQTMQNYAAQIEEKMEQCDADVLLCFDDGLCLAHVHVPIPMVLYRDTTLHTLFRYYSEYRDVCWETKRKMLRLEERSIQRCDRVLFSSDWAAQEAIETYSLDVGKVRVIPWGASIPQASIPSDIEHTVSTRKDSPCCRLLFIGINWERKGGDVAVKVATSLNTGGLQTELTIVGCNPFDRENMPSCVRFAGVLERGNREHERTLRNLLGNAHFLIVPSLEECYGTVFCEACAFGVPCLATNTGGIPSIITDGVNGQKFPIDAPIEHYCDFIREAMQDWNLYKRLSLSTYAEYSRRLNWQISAKKVIECLRECQAATLNRCR